jgi:hypothetical protein
VSGMRLLSSWYSVEDGAVAASAASPPISAPHCDRLEQGDAEELGLMGPSCIN